jgi:hypothetical protein
MAATALPPLAQPDLAPGRAVSPLPEVASVYWRPRADEQRLRRDGTLWTLSAVAHTVPFIAAAGLLMALQPLTFPVAAVALLHAWVIPELYAQRGANVVRLKRSGRPPREDGQTRSEAERAGAERAALRLLGDLVGHRARDLHARTGLVIERGHLGVWLVGEAGALLVRPGGRRVLCYCVRVAEPTLPSGDRIAHLLLALRADEQGFATVANLAFAGARWRLRRRLPAGMRAALDTAGAEASG